MNGPLPTLYDKLCEMLKCPRDAEALLEAVRRLQEANDNLFRIKQKTVVENQALKGQLATAKREITTYREFAEAQIRDLTKEKEEAYEKGKTDGKIETLKDETLP